MQLETDSFEKLEILKKSSPKNLSVVYRATICPLSADSWSFVSGQLTDTLEMYFNLTKVLADSWWHPGGTGHSWLPVGELVAENVRNHSENFVDPYTVVHEHHRRCLEPGEKKAKSDERDSQ